MKLEGDLFHVLIDILQNWEKPSKEILLELGRSSMDQLIEHEKYDQRISNNIETILKKVLSKNNQVGINSLKRETPHRRVSVKPDNHIVMSLSTKPVQIIHQGGENRMSVFIYIHEISDESNVSSKGVTYLVVMIGMGGSGRSTLRYKGGTPLNLKELYNSSIDSLVENPQEMWSDFGQNLEMDNSSDIKKSRSIYQLLQQCIDCQTTQPASIRNCVNCKSELAFCQICKLGYNTTDELIKCPNCQNLFHRAHFYAWVQAKGVCVSCKVDVTLSQI
ncbi:MAG: hypothetical protein HeimC2_44110 [Candidatus Heimdallarchaeota archaeon LC_2]|nr:MAG: hypothetical protein HeimC2_44110 [Candidatus Heimdallarchaeota archaeon LC_2]